MNPLTLIKPYLWGGAVLIVLGLFLSVFWLRDSLQDAKTEAANEKAAKTQAIQTINSLIRDAELQAKNRESYLTQLEQSQNERKRLETCIADKSCAVTVRVRIPAVCPANQENNSAGAITASAELDPIAGQRAIHLRAGTRELEAKYAFCQETLRAWAN